MKEITVLQLCLEDLEKIVETVYNRAFVASFSAQLTVYTAEQVCEIFSISRATLNNWMNDGILKPKRIGGKLYFDPQDLRMLIHNSTVPRFQ